MMRGGGKVISLSVMLSAANIMGSSGLMVWIDHSIRLNTFFLSAYRPLVLYLLGLSFGCCAVGWLSYAYRDSVALLILRKHFFLLLCGALFLVCLCLAVGNGTLVEWLDWVLRLLWGVMSGCTVVLARAMLVLPGKACRSQANFSILSLALACLPLLIPIGLSLGGFYQRTASAVVAAGLYLLCMMVVKKIDFEEQEPCIAYGDNFKYSTIVDIVNLIAINVCFFLLLMLVPMRVGLGVSGNEISTVYMGFLLLWVVIGICCVRAGSMFSEVFRFKTGAGVQCCMLLCCMLMVLCQTNGFFYVVVVLAFLANMLMQPVLFLALGRHLKYRTLFFGFQSGVYILIVCGLLFGIVYFELGMQYVFGIFWCLALLSLILSCVSIVRFNDVDGQ